MWTVTKANCTEIERIFQDVHSKFWGLRVSMYEILKKISPVYRKLRTQEVYHLYKLLRDAGGGIFRITGTHYSFPHALIEGHTYSVNVGSFVGHAQQKMRWLTDDSKRFYRLYNHVAAGSLTETQGEVFYGIAWWITSVFMTVWGPGGTLDLLSSQETLKLHRKTLNGPVRTLEKFMSDFLVGGKAVSVLRGIDIKEFRKKVQPYQIALAKRFRLGR